jgi:SpoVK/Ycf46/Vps4 family AAA+-type ATPase
MPDAITLDHLLASVRSERVSATRSAEAAIGIAALLSGGTSAEARRKAAQSIADATGRKLLHVDLGQLISKYLGETEKQLDALFDSARDSDALLFFDEADALFGKRTTVKDAHDRYANLDVSYLYHRIERHPGLMIFATNTLPTISPDMLRRLRYLVSL